MKFRTLGLLLSVTILLGVSGCDQINDTKIAYLAHNLNKSHPVHKGIKVFAEEVAKYSKGKLQVKIFPDGQLGSEREVLELLQIGSIAMTKVSAATMANFAPEYKALGVPYLFRDKEHSFSVLEGEVGKYILESGSEYLLKGLCFYDAGSRNFYTKDKPIESPTDLKGMKIRVMNHQMSVDMVNVLGGSATPMAYGELYTALQQGVVDGAENNPPSFYLSGHYEVCKHYTIDEHSSIPDALLIGTPYWNTLTPQEQEWMVRAAKVSVIAQKKFWQDNVDECMIKLAEAGVEFYRPDKSLFAQKTKSVLDELIEDPLMEKIVSQIQLQ